MGRGSPEWVFGKFQVKDEDLKLEDSMVNLYERWMTVFGVFRIDRQEKNRHFKVFKRNVKERRSVNIISDLTVEEARRRRTGYIYQMWRNGILILMKNVHRRFNGKTRFPWENEWQFRWKKTEGEGVCIGNPGALLEIMGIRWIPTNLTLQCSVILELCWKL
ncbi:hypothetical protein MKX03_025970 [Papaver bracteatum]|nr:hypothetical protein MKX03_025970 [Papaver bracteatum]